MLTNRTGKIIALDLGDQWVGVAISDITQTLAKPLTTFTFTNYIPALTALIAQENPAAVVVGYPKTLRGTESDQTKKIVQEHDKLQKLFPDIPFILWDERLSSKRAQTTSPAKTKEEKLKSHARAAAFILDSYLNYLAFNR